MSHTIPAVPDPRNILQAWLLFKELIGVTSVHTEDDYARASATIGVLLDEVGDNESHPLAEVLDYLADQIKAYEHERIAIPEVEPREILRFLLEQHELNQEDLGDCGSQGQISDILSGKQRISTEYAKRFARRFHVHADFFL